MKARDLLKLADTFVGGTRHEDETTYRIDHAKNQGHFYTGSPVEARRILRRLARFRADSITDMRVVYSDGVPDGLYVTLALESVRSVDMLIKTTKTTETT